MICTSWERLCRTDFGAKADKLVQVQVQVIGFNVAFQA